MNSTWVKFAAVTALTLGTTLAFGQTSEWTIDAAHSAGHFKIRHMMVSNVNGDVTGVDGKITLDEKDITKSKVDATLDVATINTSNAKRDEHLRSPDFFDVAKFPKMTFKATKIEKAGEGKLKITGPLTMKGVTKEVVLDVEGPSAAVKDPWGATRRGLSATTTIKRKDFGLTWNKALDGGGVVVGDDVKVELEIELQKVEAKKPAH